MSKGRSQRDLNQRSTSGQVLEIIVDEREFSLAVMSALSDGSYSLNLRVRGAIA